MIRSTRFVKTLLTSLSNRTKFQTSRSSPVSAHSTSLARTELKNQMNLQKVSEMRLTQFFQSLDSSDSDSLMKKSRVKFQRKMLLINGWQRNLLKGRILWSMWLNKTQLSLSMDEILKKMISQMYLSLPILLFFRKVKTSISLSIIALKL